MENLVEVIVVAAVLPAVLLATAFLLFLLHRRRRRRRPELPTSVAATLQEGISRLHCTYSPSCVRPTLGFHSLDRRIPGDAATRGRPHQEQPVFSWEDHPALVAEASEGGWSRFAFASIHEWPEAEVGWEKPRGSSEFMQSVRLNPVQSKPTAGRNNKPVYRTERAELGVTKARQKSNTSGLSANSNAFQTANDPSPNPYCSVMMDLPLPGPSTEGTSFPREAYFEITILYVDGQQRRAGTMDRLRNIFGRGEEPSDLSVDGDRDGDGVVALGLSRGGCDRNSGVPGTYSGSVGFFSDGSVLVDGSKVINETTKYHWSTTNKVIGCGFYPKKKKVIFTLDSELIHVVHCSSPAFANPFYPTFATNIDIMALVNLGQKPFTYKPANAWRSPNPCFALSGPLNIDSKGLISDISQELFSIEWIDSQWQEKEYARKNINISNEKEGNTRSPIARRGQLECESMATDVDTESDLFEIDLVS